jgi:hypothetical protein
MSPFMSFVSRKVIGGIAAFAVVAAALVGIAAARDTGDPSGGSDLTADVVDPQAFGAALADPASVDPASVDPASVDSASVDSGTADRGGNWKQLRADLKAARALEGDARRDALAEIRTKAQDGAYGAGIERRADRRQIHHELVFNLLPDNLQADLTALKDAPADQRKDLRAEIMDKALAGDYGPDVQKAAKQLQELRGRA